MTVRDTDSPAVTQAKRQAKWLFKRYAECHPEVTAMLKKHTLSDDMSLQKAQHAMARELGYESWMDLRNGGADSVLSERLKALRERFPK